jgi:hypothetical protein
MNIKPKEHQIYLAFILVMPCCYFLVAFWTQSFSFGFRQLRPWGRLFFGDALVAGGLTLLLWYWQPRLLRLGPTLLRQISQRAHGLFFGLLAVLAGMLFYRWHSVFYNPDAIWYAITFQKVVPLRGALVKYDEMLETFIHSRLWFYAQDWWGWSVYDTYRFCSALAGAMFIGLLGLWSRSLAGARALILVALIASGGFMQLFFGEVENYTLVSVMILGYFWGAHQFVVQSKPLTLPAALLALALCFHLLTGWLLPSFLFLIILAIKRGKYGELFWAGLIFGAIILGTILFFHTYYLSASNLIYDSFAFGHGGKIGRNFVTPTWDYYWQIFNLLFLLFPAWPIIIPLILYRRLRLTPYNGFLIIASLSMLLFILTWKAALGPYYDWNLFAPAIIPFTLLVWINFVAIRDLAYWPAIGFGLLFNSALPSYGWIIGNHYYRNIPEFLRY